MIKDKPLEFWYNYREQIRQAMLGNDYQTVVELKKIENIVNEKIITTRKKESHNK